MAEIGIVKRRKPWLAALMSLVSPGWGQLYNGQLKKAVVLYGAMLLVGTLMLASFGSFALLASSLVLLIAVHVAASAEAYLRAGRLRDYTLRPINRWWVYVLVIVLNIGVSSLMEVTVMGNYKAYKVSSVSMLQSMQVGDRFMVRLLDAEVPLERGDIAIFIEPEGKRDFVKRVIGLPGESIEMRNKEVFINGHRLDEPYVFHSKENYLPLRDEYGPKTLGVDEYFMLGDNRESSYDSRFFGPIPRSEIKGRAEYVYIPGLAGSKGWAGRFGEKLR